MNSVFPATLENGVITWGPNGAPPPTANGPVAVEVVVPTPATTDPNDKRTLRQLFEKLASMGTFDDIEDPVEWQREIHRDRPMERREE